MSTIGREVGFLNEAKGGKKEGKKTLQSSAKTLTFWLLFYVDSYLIHIYIYS